MPRSRFLSTAIGLFCLTLPRPASAHPAETLHSSPHATDDEVAWRAVDPDATTADAGPTEQLEWCMTDRDWVRHRSTAAMRGGGCVPDCPPPDSCPCDQPANRNAAIPSQNTPIKYIRLKFNVFRNDDGSNPAAMPADVVFQLQTLNNDFLPWRIQFVAATDADSIYIDSSRDRVLEAVPCGPDPECYGDCDADQMKINHADHPNEQLNIYIVEVATDAWGRQRYLGRGTFPWDDFALTRFGGIVLHESALTSENRALTHEVGHCLGLWHTFHGVDEWECQGFDDPCDWPCRERVGSAPSDTTGDFCSETPPTPVNFGNCANPSGGDECSNDAPWNVFTSYRNHMGYAPNDCRNHFTPQQAGRMHCWIEATLSSWLVPPPPENFYISGYVMSAGGSGIFGVTVSANNNGGSTVTDALGYYRVAVPNPFFVGWSGRITPSLAGYNFTPPYRDYQGVDADVSGQNYTAASAVSPPTVTTLAASVYPTSAFLNGYVTDTGGAEIIEAKFTWGTNPSTLFQSCTQVGWSQNNFACLLSALTPGTTFYFQAWARNSAGWGSGSILPFTAGNSTTTYTISGLVRNSNGVGLSGVTLTATNGGGSATTTSNGGYSLTVSAGWTGQVTPFRTGFTFNPTSTSYNSVSANQPNQNYTATSTAPSTYQIRGELLMEGSPFPDPVELEFTPAIPGSPFTVTSSYNVTVPAGWSGRVRPSRSGYRFSPSYREYSNLSRDRDWQDYDVIQRTVSPILTVEITPQAAVDAGAQWTQSVYLNGEVVAYGWPWWDSGITRSLGYVDHEYRIQFKNIDGWDTPAEQRFTALANQTYTIVGPYVQHVGSVQVELGPEAARNAGAQWSLNQGPWRPSGYPEVTVPVGVHEVRFSTIPNWFTPAPRAVTVTRNQTSNVSQVYTSQSATGPTITSVSPGAGPTSGGSTVLISGTRLFEPLTAAFGSTSATSVTWLSETTVRVVTPPHASIESVSVSVTTPEGTATLPAGYTYTAQRGQNVELVEQIGGGCFAIDVQGNFAFIGEGANLVVLNVSSPSSPTRTAKLLLGGFVQDIAVSGARAYVAAQEAGVYVVDLGDPSNPTPSVVGVCDTPGLAWAVKEVGGRVYIADRNEGLRIWDIVTNPDRPEEIAFLPIPDNAVGLDVKGTGDGLFAYVAAETSGLHIIDVTEPSSPIARGSYPTSYSTKNVVVANSIAYVANHYGQNTQQGLQIIDVADPDSPTLIGSHNAVVQDVVVQNSRVYIVGSSPDIAVLDVSIPSVPVRLGSLSVSAFNEKVAVFGGRAFVANRDRGMSVVNVSTPSGMTLMGNSDTARGAPQIGSAISVAVESGLVYAGTGNLGVSILDMDMPLLPLQGRYNGSSGVQHLAVDGDLAYLNESGGVRILNVSNPSSVVSISLYEPESLSFFALAQSGTELCLGGRRHNDGQNVLQILDVSNPASPAPRGTVSVNMDVWPTGIAKSGNFVYVAGQGLRIVDISNRDTPVLRGQLPLPGTPDQIAVLGQEVYVAAGSAGLQIINVSNPSQPVIDRAYDTPGNATGVAVGRGMVFLADTWDGGLQVLDAHVPGATPVLIGYYDTPGYANRLSLANDDDLIYLSDGFCGVAVLRLKDFITPTVTITTPVFAPAYTTATSPIPLGGAAEDNVGVIRVAWDNDRGVSGVSSGTDSWFVPAVSLQPGINVISVTAYDEAGNAGSDVLTVTYTPADTQAPVVEILTPTVSDTYVTAAAMLSVGGSASDNVGVTEVLWSDGRGDSGTAIGTVAWNTEEIPLQVGENTITVTASDAAGYSGSDTLVVQRCAGPTDGDMNADGAPNGRDVPLFVSAVLRASTSVDEVCRGDFSGSGLLDIDDVPSFVAALLNP